MADADKKPLTEEQIDFIHLQAAVAVLKGVEQDEDGVWIIVDLGNLMIIEAMTGHGDGFGFGRLTIPLSVRMPHHVDRPTKICPVCGRPFQWRRKWKDIWEDVRYCSDRCRRHRNRVRPEDSEGPQISKSTTSPVRASGVLPGFTSHRPRQDPGGGRLRRSVENAADHHSLLARRHW